MSWDCDEETCIVDGKLVRAVVCYEDCNTYQCVDGPPYVERVVRELTEEEAAQVDRNRLRHFYT